MKKILKWTAIVLGSLLAVALIAGLILHEPRPEGESGPAAEALARKMLEAINIEAWDTTRYVKWNFAGMHEYLWDKEEDRVIVWWDEQKVVLNTQNQKGKAWRNDEQLAGEAADELLSQAWSFFCNDSFWLNAPAKAFDPGTKRQLVKLENGEEALLMQYTSGGVTPGDSYLWILDENGRPKAWKMWVQIIPIGGVQSTWSGWETLSTGAQVATLHETAGVKLEITDLAGGLTLSDIDITGNPFE